MSLNFTGIANIKYLPPQKFNEMINTKKVKEVCAFPNWSIDRQATMKKPMYSQGANTCSILAIGDTMVHIPPETRPQNFIEKLVNLINKEKEKNDDLSAFIIGGRKNDNDSFNLFNDIGNVLEKENVDFSMLCGKGKEPRFGVDSLCKDGDTFIFTQNRNDNLEKEIRTNKDFSPSKLEEIFQKFYDIIEISPKHTIIK